MIKHLIGARWSDENVGSLPIYNPATGGIIDEVPLAGTNTLDVVVNAAELASESWALVPVMERVQLMFRFRSLLEEHANELAEIVSIHHGKTVSEALGEVRRGIEVVDFACGAPSLLQGRTLREVGRNVDQDLYRYPLGVVAGITPFNFPVMIPLWMFPLAVVAGNTFILKPSEQTPLGAVRLAELFLEAGFPPGVLNVVHGSREIVEGLCTAQKVAAISFVGSAPAARAIYRLAAANGKRVQAAGGAKNHLIVMPDADLELVVPSVMSSAFGNAGERCLAGSVVIGVEGVHKDLSFELQRATSKLVVGAGDKTDTDVGPLIREESRQRVLNYISSGVNAGATLLVDGRDDVPPAGFFVGPTLIDGVTDQIEIGREEIFGPVLGMNKAESLDEAIAQLNRVAFGNMAAIFTRSGEQARRFRETAQAGMLGINIGVAQPFGFYPFTGWRDSFYGDLHPNGEDAIQFYTRKKVVVSRWT